MRCCFSRILIFGVAVEEVLGLIKVLKEVLPQSSE